MKPLKMKAKHHHAKCVFAATAVATACLLSSCDWLWSFHDDTAFIKTEIYNYNLTVSATDATGNDVVKGIALDDWNGSSEADAVSGKVNKDACNMSVKHKYTSEQNLPALYNLEGQPLNMLKAEDGKCYLQESCQTYKKLSDGQVHIVYKLCSQHIFGDKDEHTIDTYWEYVDSENVYDENTGRTNCYPKCVKAEFNGAEIPVDTQMLSDRYYKVNISIPRD